MSERISPDMPFVIRGKSYEVTREAVLDATKQVMPVMADSRHKYFVKLHDRHYPIKQVIRLVTGLKSGFYPGDARRILTALDFEVTEESSPAVPQSRSGIYGNTLKLLAIFETDEDGWIVASCPTLPGCHTQGRSKAESLSNLREAIMGYLASMREHGLSLPASSEFEVVEVVV